MRVVIRTLWNSILKRLVRSQLLAPTENRMHNVKYKFKDGIEEPKHYYGYVYEVKIHSGKLRHKYGGGKEGELAIRDEYYGSVVTHLEEYERDFYNNKVTITIIMFLTKCKDDIWRAENRHLLTVNAKDNLEYFNETNGGSKVNKKDDAVLELLNKIDRVGKGENVDGITVIDSNAEYIAFLDYYQPRPGGFVPGQKRKIAKKIDEFGDEELKKVLPVPTLKDYNGKKKHKRIGHSHILGALALTKKYKNNLSDASMKLMLIDKKLWTMKGKPFTELQIEELSGGLNPEVTVISTPTGHDHYVKLAISRLKEDKIEINSDANFFHFKALGKFHGHTVRAILKKATQINDEEKSIGRGRIKNGWSEEDRLIQKKNDYISQNTTDNYKVLSFKSDQERLIKQNLWDFLVLEKPEEDMTFETLIEHPDRTSKKGWSKLQVELEKSILFYTEAIEEKYGARIEVKFKVLDYDRKHTSKFDSINDVNI